MFSFLKKNNDENKESTLMEKLYDRQIFTHKLDFNSEHLNKYLLKCINSYLAAIYKQDPSLCEKYLIRSFYEDITEEINKSKKIFKYSNDYINITKAELEDQKIESINYVSFISIAIDVAAVYHRQNVFTETIRKIEEVYTESVIFSFEDNGWKIKNVSNQNIKLMNDDTIIKL